MDTSYRKFRPKGPILLTGLLVLVIVLFSTWQLFRLVEKPTITLDDSINTEGFTVAENNIITISGSERKVAFLYINDEARPILTDHTFHYDLYTPPGLSTIEIRAVDRYGRASSEVVNVYNPESPYQESIHQELAKSAVKNFELLDSAITNSS